MARHGTAWHGEAWHGKAERAGEDGIPRNPSSLKAVKHPKEAGQSREPVRSHGMEDGIPRNPRSSKGLSNVPMMPVRAGSQKEAMAWRDMALRYIALHSTAGHQTEVAKGADGGTGRQNKKEKCFW